MLCLLGKVPSLVWIDREMERRRYESVKVVCTLSVKINDMSMSRFATRLTYNEDLVSCAVVSEYRNIAV